MRALLLFFTTSLLYAHVLGEPMMPTMVFDNTQAMPKVHKCHDISEKGQQSSGSRLITKAVNTDYFNADVSCEYKCKGKKARVGSKKERFDPAKLGLFLGDGSSDRKILWRSLGTTLQVWSKDICSQVAHDNCSEVESFKIKEIKSGDWKFDGVFNCQRKDIVASPFDEGFSLDNAGMPTYSYNSYFDYENPKYDQPSPLSNYLPKGLKAEDVQAYVLEKDQGSCKHRAKVYTCFGDCIFQKNKDDRWIETLITNEYFGDYPVDVCMDQFAEKFKSLKNSSDKDLLCHKLIWEIFRRSNATGVSCAAFRFDYVCPVF